MKTLVRPLCLVISVLWLPACHVVSTPRPIGTTPVKMAKADWDGSWLVTGEDEDKSVLHLRVTDEAKGYAALGIMEFKDKRFSAQQISLNLRSLAGKNSTTIQIINALDQESGRWHPSVLTRKGDTLTARPLDPAQLRALATAGKLPAIPEPAAPPPPSGASASAPKSDKIADISIHADEAWTAALEKFIADNGPDACLDPDPKSAVSIKRLTKE